MTSVCCNTYGRRAAIWQAYHALDEQGKGQVLKSQLKVLTHNLGSSLGLMVSLGTQMDDFRASETQLSFSEYMEFLQKTILKLIADSSDIREDNTILDKLDDVCWLVCSKSVYSEQSSKVIEEKVAFKLWKVFNVLAQVDENDENEEPLTPVVIDVEEVQILMQKLHKITGTPFVKKDEFDQKYKEGTALTFGELLQLVESHLSTVNKQIAANVVAELYEEYILGVLKKGYLSKKGPLFSWKDRWCLLTPTCLRYYTNRDEKELKGEVKITAKCTVESLSDKFVIGTGSKPNRFLVKTEGRDYEVSAMDTLTKTEWLAAFKLAIDIQNNNYGKSKSDLRQRRLSRLARREKLSQEQLRQKQAQELMEKTQQQLEEEILRREALTKQAREDEEKRLRDQEMMAKTQEELEAAKQSRLEAEARWAEAESIHERDRERLKELELMQIQLESLLENERLAREQEEASRIVQEEIAEQERLQNQQLEEVQAMLELMLKDEQLKRENVEDAKKKQEELLMIEKKRLEELREERIVKERICQEALEKLHQAEKERDEAQNLLRKKKETTFGAAFYKFDDPEMETDPSLLIKITHRGQGAFPWESKQN